MYRVGQKSLHAVYLKIYFPFDTSALLVYVLLEIIQGIYPKSLFGREFSRCCELEGVQIRIT